MIPQSRNCETQQQLLLQQAQAQLLAAAMQQSVQQSNAAHAAHAAHAAAQANQQAQAAAAANQHSQQQQAGQTGQQGQSQPQGQSTQEQTGQPVPVPPTHPQLTLSQPIQLTAQVLATNHKAHPGWEEVGKGLDSGDSLGSSVFIDLFLYCLCCSAVLSVFSLGLYMKGLF